MWPKTLPIRNGSRSRTREKPHFERAKASHGLLQQLTTTQPARFKRLFDLAKWFAPGAALLLIPKCPLCIVAYVAAFSGVGLSLSAAHNLRLGLIAASVTAIAYLVIRSLLARRQRINKLL